MAENTAIPWASDTFNPWIGCSKISEECEFCYADQMDKTRFSKVLGGTPDVPTRHWGPGAPRHKTSLRTWISVRNWAAKPLVCNVCAFPVNQLCNAEGENCLNPNRLGCPGKLVRRRIFCGSLCDWADMEVPDLWRNSLFDLAEQCDSIIWMFLSKRPAAALNFLMERYPDRIPGHFWGGMSWMRRKADTLRPFLETPWPVRFLSVEPMLGPFEPPSLDGIAWVIFGGESGDQARPCHIDWIRDGIKRCRDAGVAPFVKQMGSNAVGSEMDKWVCRMKHPKGADMAEWPLNLQVQELPKYEHR